MLMASAGIVRFFASGLAMWVALRLFRRRLLAEVRGKRGWHRRGLYEGVRAAQVPWPIWLMYAGLALLTVWVVHDHHRRLDLFANGHQAQGQVAYSGTYRGRGSCQVEFELVLDQAKYRGASTQCKLRDAHPAGSMIAVRYDPAAPDGVLAEGDTGLNALVAFPILMWPIFVLMILFGLVPSVRGYAPVKGSRSQRR